MMTDNMLNNETVDNSAFGNAHKGDVFGPNTVTILRYGLLIVMALLALGTLIQLLQSFAIPLADGSVRLSLQGFIQTTNSPGTVFSAWLLPEFVSHSNLGLWVVKSLNLLLWLLLLSLSIFSFKFIDQSYQQLLLRQEQLQVKIKQKEERTGEKIYSLTAEQHLRKIKVIAEKIHPLVKIFSALIMFLLCLLIATLIAQALSLLLPDGKLLPWIGKEDLSSWQEYLFLINIIVSISLSLSLWFGYQFLTSLSRILMNFGKGAVFVSRNGRAVFKLAKYYLLGALSYIPGSIVEGFSTSIDCQKTSFTTELLGRFADFLMGDLIFIALLFITAHIITLAIRLDHEQRLTV